MKRSLFKFVKIIFFISLAIYFFDQGTQWLQGTSMETFPEEMKKFGMYLLFSFLIGGSNMWLVDKLDVLFPWSEVPQKRVIFGIIGAILVSMMSILAARMIIVLGLYRKDWIYFLENEEASSYFISLMISLVVVLGFYSYHFFKEISQKKIQEHQVVAQTETAKFESLKSQLDPHFLFNSLNVLTSLIEENPKNAAQFTQKLSHIYRYVLEQKDKDLVDLGEELTFAKTYMELLKMRFEEAIQYELPENISNSAYKIVPLSLQLLLENAVKHNVLSSENPLIIKITEQNGELSVLNNFNEKSNLTRGAGIGIKNIVDRYALLTYKKVIIEKTEATFKIVLPLLTQITPKMNTTNLNEENRYIKARKQVEKMKEFYSNLAAYVVIIPFLIFINYKTSWGFKWFYFPMLGWGIGLTFHFLDAFGYNWILGKNWEDKKIKELMDEPDQKNWE